MQEYRYISEIYNYQPIQLSVIKLINAILCNLGGGRLVLTWPGLTINLPNLY